MDANNVQHLLCNLKAKYQQASKLMEVNNDPQQEPYKSKYAAKEIISHELVPQLDQLRSVTGDATNWLPHRSRLDIIEAVLNYELSRIANETEETTQADVYIKIAKDCLLTFTPDLLDIRLSLVTIKILNQIGLIKTYFEDYVESMNALNLAEKVYKSFTSSEVSKESICHLEDLFDLAHCNCDDDLEDLSKSIECLYTSTVYFIAQVYQKTHQPDEAAKYCVLTLQRQYSSLESFDTIDWAINAATLSQYYFLTLNNFGTARHMIAASLMLMSNLKAYDTSDLFSKRQADIERIIVKYCLHLLEKGANLVVPGLEQVPTQEASESDKVTDRLIEPSDTLTALEETLPVSVPSSFVSAREVFLVGQSKIKSAMNYFTLNEHASDYSECIGDYDQLFRWLTLYEKDQSRIFAMSKKRIKLLEELLGEINPQYFLSYHRKYSFEVADIYQELAHMKIKEYRLKEEEIKSSLIPGQSIARTLVEEASKINRLIDASIKWFTNYRNHYADPKTKKLPSKYEDEAVRPLIVATFSIAKLVSNKITYDVSYQVNFLTTAEAYYNEVIAYYDLNQSHRSIIETEVGVVRELLPLLTERKTRLATSTLY